MATTLSAGDVAFLSIIGDNPDTFAFVLLKDIDAGTIINITDNGWLSTGAFRTGEGVLQYVAPSAQTVGTVINYIDGAVNTGWTNISGGTTFGLSTSGDSLIAFQGTLTGSGNTTTSTSPTLLAAVTVNRSSFDASATNANTTALPTGLTVGTNAVAVGQAAAEFDNSRYTGATTFASVAEARTAINTASNWTGSDTDLTNFTGTFNISSAPAPINSIDLSKYIRTGVFNLPVALTGNLLAREVSAVTYNKDTDTLFVVGDGGTAIVQVSKTGQLIDSMQLTAGLFADPEGLTYVGNGQFVIADERVRTASRFTYAAGTTLTAANVQTVKLGTTIGNIGIEGITFDPLTNGFIAVKEENPLGVFQTSIDFTALTASNGSPTTVNSTDLFNPTSAGLLDFADVFAFSTLSPTSDKLLLLSQASGKIVNIDRAGNISSSLTIVSESGNTLSVPDQQFEGLTVDKDGFLYVTSENGDTPQLSVYKPSAVPNQAPTAVVFSNTVTAISELDSTVAATRVANIAITDDQLGVNTLSLTGADAAFFEITGNSLFLKANTVLDFETKPSFSVSVNVDDSTVGNSPDATTTFTLNVTDVVDETPLPTTSTSIFVTEVAPWSSGNSLVAADWFELTNTGSSAVNISGWKFDDNSNSFASSVLLNGIATIGAGESVIFIEGATSNPTFLTNWFGANPPANLKIGTYSGSGIGLSTGGDAVNIFNAAGVLQASVTFGASPAASPFTTFDNAALLQNTAIATQSAVGVNGAFSVTNNLGVSEVGSPGAIANPVLPPSIKISQIQGASQVSPLVGQNVSAVAGIVTAVDSNGFYFQDPNPDNNIATSEGIFVFTSSAPTVKVGDSITVTGRVSEFTPGGTSTGNLSTTQIGGTLTINVLSSGNPLPSATIIGSGGRVPPNQIIDNDGLTSFDPTTDGIDFFESLEGMRVTAKNLLSVSPTNSFGEIYAVVDNGAGATGLSQRGTINIAPNDFNPERIQIDADTGVFDFAFPNVNVGAKLGDVTGVVSYNFGNFEIIPTEAFVNNIQPSTLQPEVTTLSKGSDTLLVATYNVLNLDPNEADGDTDIANGRFNKIAQQIINNLKSPDIIGLQEIQDNSGSANDGVTSASLTLQTLVNAIAAAGGPQYKFIDNTFISNNTSGGQPGANIRTAFLYNDSRVGLVDGSVKTVPNSAFAAFADSRLPLIADFTFNGETVTVITNHLSSKGGSRPLFGTTQPSVGDEINGNGQENVNINGSLDQRRAQAQAVNDYVDGILATKLDAKVVVVGDFNEFEFISPLNIVAGGNNPVLTNLTNALPENDRYTFNFDGNSQSLDHILVSNNLSGSSKVDIVNINTEFVDNNQRASDHDPIVATLKIVPTAPTLAAVGSIGDDKLIAIQGTSFDGKEDIVFTGAGNDSVELTTVAAFQNAGNNRIDAGSGKDEIFVNKGDRLFGGEGDDVFFANDSKGGNRMSGGLGNDDFFLGFGDRALGGEGNDRFFVTTGGGNLLSGGAGSDQFWIFNAAAPSSANTILDFQNGTDVIGINGAGLGFGFANLTLSGNTISIAGKAIATLTNVDVTSLTSANFVFQ